MRHYVLRAWVLTTILAIARPMPATTAPASGETPAISPAQAAEEREACTRNLKVIYDAIQAYQFDHKDLPNWLSDLVPDYLTDGNVLICPVCRRTGRTESPPLADPKLACSYIFEFSPAPVGITLPGQLKHTRREWKRRQMGLIGSAVPIVRCRNHNPVINLGFNGTIFESPPQWELVFTNRIRAAELSLRAIFGGEDTPEEAMPVVNPVRTQTRKQPPIQAHTIDLKPFYTSSLAEAWLGDPSDDLASVPRGTQSFAGVEFEVGGVVQLQGKAPALARFPAQVKAIPVHQKCQHLYFLHAATVNGPAEIGDQIGSYLVHLPNSEMTLEIPIYYGQSVLNWHAQPGELEQSKELKVAWTGQNDATPKTGKSVRLFLTAWNLAPGVEVDTLDFVSAGKGAAPVLLGISFD